MASQRATTDGRQLRRRGQRTRQGLLDSGMQLLADRGYHAVRVEDIVRSASTSHGTFYLYFANKEDLFRALAEECAAEMTELAAGLGPIEPGPAGLQALEEWLTRWFGTARRHQAVIRAWIEFQVPDRELTRLGARAFSDVRSSLVDRLAQAGVAHLPDPQLAATAMLAMIERFTYFLLSGHVDVSDEEGVSTLARLLHRGFFGAPAGRRRR